MDNMFDFGDSPVDLLEQSLHAGDVLPASKLLSVMDGQSEWELYEVLDRLQAKGVTVALDRLAVPVCNADTALRLRREEQLVKSGSLPGDLEANDPLRLYLEELAQVPVYGDLAVLEAELVRANQNGHTEDAVYQRVFEHCISRAVEIAGEYVNQGVLLADLIQEGSTGLWSDLPTYSGGGLAQFRDDSLRRHMQRAILAQAHAAGVGQKLRQDLEDYRNVDERLLTELGRNPTLEEIAEAMHMDSEQAAMVAAMVENARSLHRAKHPESTEVMPEEEDQAVEDTAYFQMRQRITELLSVLPAEDAKLLTLRYGLEGGVPLTPQQTGAKLGMTPEEVVAAEAAALSKLRTQ